MIGWVGSLGIIRGLGVSVLAIVAVVLAAYGAFAAWLAIVVDDPRSEFPVDLFWHLAGGAFILALIFVAAAFVVGSRRHRTEAWLGLGLTAFAANLVPFVEIFGKGGYAAHGGLLLLAGVAFIVGVTRRPMNGDAHA